MVIKSFYSQTYGVQEINYTLFIDGNNIRKPCGKGAVNYEISDCPGPTLPIKMEGKGGCLTRHSVKG